MTIHDLKDALRNYPKWTEKINNIKQEIENAKEEAQAVREASSIIIDGMPNGNALSDPTYQKAVKVIEKYEKRINKLLDDIDKIMDRQQMLTDVMRGLLPDEHALITARYFDGIHWDFVPSAVNMGRRKCFYVHDRAMYKMIQLLDFTKPK